MQINVHLNQGLSLSLIDDILDAQKQQVIFCNSCISSIQYSLIMRVQLVLVLVTFWVFFFFFFNFLEWQVTQQNLFVAVAFPFYCKRVEKKKKKSTLRKFTI